MKKLISFLALTAVFFSISLLAVNHFSVNHTLPDGNVVTQTFTLGEVILIKLGGSFVAATITKIGRSAFTVRFSGGGQGSFNKTKAVKMPLESHGDQKNLKKRKK